MLLTILAVVFSAPAAVAVWPDPTTVAGGVSAYNARGALASDGTPVVAWYDDSGVHARVGGGAVVLLDSTQAYDIDVAAASDQLAVFWRTADGLKVALGTVSGGLGEPKSLGQYELEVVAGNSAGEMSLLLRWGEGRFLVFRPAGGGFGQPVAAPPPAGQFALLPKLALGASGESLLVWQDPNGVHAVSRERDGPIGAVVEVPGPTPCQIVSSAYPLALALDGHGRAIATWLTNTCLGNVVSAGFGAATRVADGTWKTLEAFPEIRPLQAGTGDEGQAVVTGYDDKGFVVIPVNLDSALLGPENRLAISVISGHVPHQPDAHGTWLDPELAVAPNGSASLIWGEDREVHVLRRSGSDAFGNVETAACQQLFGTSPSPLGVAVDGTVGALFNAYPGGQLSTAQQRSGAEDSRTCPPTEPSDPYAQPVAPVVQYSRSPILAGQPVNVTIPGLRRSNAAIVSATWEVQDGATVRTNGDSATLTFPRPGSIGWAVSSKQRYEVLGDLDWSYYYRADVFAPATLTAKKRQRRRLRIRASALSDGKRALVAVTASRGGKVRAKVSGLLGLGAKRIELKVRKPGRYRVALVQGGVTQASTKVQVIR